MNLSLMHRLKNVAPLLMYALAIVIVAIGLLFTLTYQQKHVSADFCSFIDPASVCPPTGAGFICICSGFGSFGDPGCYTGCLAVPSTTCEDVGMTGGPWPMGCVAIPTCSASMGNSCTSSSGNSCGMYGSGSIQCNGSCSASAPSDSLCPAPPPPPTCADYGQLGTYPSCYAAPPSCTADATCGGARANTCTTATCSDTCGNSYYGTKTCTVPPPTSCTSPTVSITAAPTRVSAGGSSTLTVAGTGINTTCTVTNKNTGAVLQSISASSCNASGSSIPTGNLSNQTTFQVSCDSGAAVSTVIVNVNPTFKPF